MSDEYCIVEPPSEGPILVIAAHPDDMESWCGGTIACAINQGVEASLLLTTAGDKGSQDPNVDPIELGLRRTREARVAADKLGLREVIQLGYLDGEVENTHQLRRELAEAIRRIRPEVVFTFDPEHPLPRYISHRDHRLTGRAALDVIYPLARDPLNFREQLRAGLEPHKVRQVWLFASQLAHNYVNIEDGLEQKIEARIAHESQTADPESLRENWRKRAAERGADVGLPAAEVFTIIEMRR